MARCWYERCPREGDQRDTSAGNRWSCALHLPNCDNREALRQYVRKQLASGEPINCEGTYLADLTFDSTDWKVPATFADAQIGNVLLTGCVFAKGLVMSSVKVAKSIKIARCDFLDTLDLSSLSCQSLSLVDVEANEVLAQEVRVTEKTNLLNCKIGGIDLSSGIFREEFLTAHLLVDGPATLKWCSFEAGASFNETRLRGTADFTGVRLSKPPPTTIGAPRGSLDFVCGMREPGEMFGAEALFRDIPGEPHIVFDAVGLQQASFVGTDLSQCACRHVRWRSRKGQLRSVRRCLADEFDESASTPRHLELLSDNYHQLLEYYQARRNFDAAEDFHVGELEVKRLQFGARSSNRAKAFLCRTISVLSVYRLGSIYGSSHTRAILVLGCLLLLLSLLLMMTGLQSNDGGRKVNYRLTPSADALLDEPSKLLEDYGATLVFVLEVATLQRVRSLQPASLASSAIVAIGTVLIAGQVALALLALRRRYKR